MRILIVEDDHELGQLLKDYLERLGHERVVHALTGHQALQELSDHSFDCAFVDLQLPDIGGLEILHTLKTHDPSLPVIIMSGYPTIERSIEAMRRGASDFLTKPFAFQDLVFALERALREREILLENVSLRLEKQARIELEKLNKQLEATLEEQKLLFSVSNELDQVSTSDSLYETIVRWGLKLSGAKRAGFYVIIPPGHEMVLVAESKSKSNTAHTFPQMITNRVFEKPPDTIFQVQMNRNILTLPSQIDVDTLMQTMIEHVCPQGCHCRCWNMDIRGEPFGFLISVYEQDLPDIPKANQRILDFLLKKAGLTLENLALYESLIANFYGILRSLVNALEAKDTYTGKHSERVTTVALKLARFMGCSHSEIESIKTMGYLHDIGKIGIPDTVLNKPGRLTPEEFELIKQHPIIGESIVKDLGLSEIDRSIIRHHHERWDGKGYPDGIGGTDIPLTTRIITVADAYDAMYTDRPYRKAMKLDRVKEELIRNSGTQFDPQIVEAFLEMLNLEKTQKGDRNDNDDR